MTKEIDNPVQVFTLEQAGSRVGWSSAVEKSGISTAVDVVVATVGPEGAAYGYTTYAESDRMPEVYAEGFTAASGLSVVIMRNRGVIQVSDPVLFVAEGMQGMPEKSRDIVAGGVYRRPGTPKDSDKRWGNNPSEVLDGLKRRLVDLDLEDNYKTLYYLLNGYIGHEDYWSRGTDSESFSDLLLPDPEMHELTVGQQGLAIDIVSSLRRVKAENERMKQRLTIFGDIPKEDILDTFTDSRREVARQENAMLEANSDLHHQNLVHRPDSRVWDYMNPLAKDEKKAFGYGLRDLRSERTQALSQELGHEITEVGDRITYALRGSHALEVLGRREVEAGAVS